jgi:hypothetical protein
MGTGSGALLAKSGLVSPTRILRPTRVAILYSEIFSSRADHVHDDLIRRFASIGVNVFSTSEMTQAGINELVSSSAYDVIGLIGEPKEFDLAPRNDPGRFKFRSPSGKGTYEERSDDPIVLAFAPTARFVDTGPYLKIANAIVLCDVPGKNWVFAISDLAYNFFESLVVPSMLNIDLADVKHIARGIGLALNLSDDSHKKIISLLPRRCLVARSALLHFSCDPDVRLREVYSISKAIALKKGISGATDPEIRTHADAKKVIRKVNVKMGIRMMDPKPRKTAEIESDNIDNEKRKRISLTAIFFGL